MIVFSVKTNFDQVTNQLATKFQSQIPFASALALTRTAQDVQREVVKQLPAIFEYPTPFTLNAIAVTAALKSRLTSSVYIRPQQAKYLSVEITGGTVEPANRALPTPVDIRRTIYGGLPLSAVKNALRRPNTFSGTIHGRQGIWQRIGNGRVILLIGWSQQWNYKPRFDFAGIAQRVIADRAIPNLQDALSRALATAR
jgi:hypothetical protein